MTTPHEYQLLLYEMDERHKQEKKRLKKLINATKEYAVYFPEKNGRKKNGSIRRFRSD